ncbi:alpha/beta hydrolase [Gammaproteobacteria bacterium]|nr:alpha/beta hydrolase [Gammaproteobacteria bacterium]
MNGFKHGALALVSLGLAACMPDMPSLDDYPQLTDLTTIKADGVHAVQRGCGDCPRLLFVHGSPGRWQDFLEFLADDSLAAQFDLVAIDRPGFGETGGPVRVEFADQVAAIAPFVEGAEHRPVYIVSWSLGGPVSLLAARRYPLAGLLMVAPSMDPSLEAPRWYNTLLDWRAIRAIAPDFATASNDEMMVHAQQLQELAGELSAIDLPIELVQGRDDGLVYPQTVDYARAHLANAQLNVTMVEGAGHDVLWSHPDLIREALLRLTRSAAR